MAIDLTTARAYIYSKIDELENAVVNLEIKDGLMSAQIIQGDKSLFYRIEEAQDE